MTPVFLDTSVILLALGGKHPWRESCRRVLQGAARGDLRIHLSVEAGQEFLFHRMRRTDRATALAQFSDLDAMVIWHPFDRDVLLAASELVRQGHIRGRDAVHAATALAAGFTTLVSYDEDFRDIPGLRMLTPDQV